MDAISKSEVIKAVAKGLSIRKDDVALVLGAIEDHVVEQVLAGNNVRLGFVTLKVNSVADRNGRNPRTGETVFCPGHKVVKASVTPALRKQVKGASLSKGASKKSKK